MAHRSATSTLTLPQQLDYRRKLREQFPTAPHRVVYTKSGMYLAAAHLADPAAIIDHKLYWAAVADAEEGRFLAAILNSDTLLQAIRPLQARGEHNPRDFDKYVFQAPIPLYDPDEQAHRDLVALSERAEAIAAGVDIKTKVSFQAQRREIRRALAASDVGAQLEQAVAALVT